MNMEKSNLIRFPQRPDPSFTPSSLQQVADIIHLPQTSDQEFCSAFDEEEASRRFFEIIEPRIELLSSSLSEEAFWLQVSIAEDYYDHAETDGIRSALKYTNDKLDSMQRHPATLRLIKPSADPQNKLL